jgi:signal transduction histidine kinase
LRGLAELKKLSLIFGKANDIAEILDILIERALSETGATNAVVILAEQESQNGHIAARRGPGIDPAGGRAEPLAAVDADFLSRALQADDVFEIAEPQLTLDLFGAGSSAGPELTVVPLITQNATEGLLVVHTRIRDDEARYMLGALAYLAGDAIEHLRFATDRQRQRFLLDTIGQLGRQITSSFDLNEFLPYAVKSICNHFTFVRVTLYLRNSERLIAYRVEQGQPAAALSSPDPGVLNDGSPTARTIGSGQSSRIDDKEAESVFSTAHLDSRSRSEFATPVLLGDQVIGSLTIESDRAYGFGAEDLFAIQALSDLIALAVESARLLGQSDRRLSELAALINLGHAITSVLDQKKVSQLILDGAAGLTDSDCAALYLKNANDLMLAATLNRGAETLDESQIFNIEQAVLVTQSGQPLNLPSTGQSGRSVLSVPLRVKHNIIGVIQLVRQGEAYAFDTDDERLTEALALPSSVALENARLYEETERRLAEVSTLYTLAQRMTSSLDLNQMLDSLVVILRRVIDCRGCCIFLLDEHSGLLEIRAASGLKPKWQREAKLRVGEGVSGRVVQIEKPIYIRDTLEEEDFIFFDTEVRSLLVVPMITKGHVIGTLSVDDDSPNAFDEDEGRLLTIAAAQAATTIENARLYESLKERARRLKLAYDELKELNRLKSEFVQNVSHELRTPLTFVRGYVELLLDGSLGELSSTQMDAIQVVSAKTEALTSLVGDIISLQKAEMTALELAPVSLADVIDLAFRGAEATIQEAHLTLTRKIPHDLAPVFADRSRLGQVLDNLIGNALKFTPAGGNIDLQIEDIGDFERVLVSDTGIGIPGDKLEKVFEPFYQIDGSSTRRFGGAGLGLAIVRQIVEAHGGEVGVVSEPGKGSIFHFTVPKYRPGSDVLLPSDLDMQLS